MQNLKIISWNCQGAFRNKYEHILKFNPDILIIQECEDLEKLYKTEFDKNLLNNSIRIKESNSKGVAIFAKPEFKIDLHDSYNINYRHIIPIQVKNLNLNIFAIWAMNNKNEPQNRYIAQVFNAINYYDKDLFSNSILIGDFNGNQIWDNDKPKYTGNYTQTIEKLKTLNVFSMYHTKTNENFGEEKQKSFFMYKKQEKGYHIDYCFASKSILDNGFEFQICNFEDYKTVSDHVPIIAEINL